MIILKRLPFVDTFMSVADFFGTDTKANLQRHCDELDIYLPSSLRKADFAYSLAKFFENNPLFTYSQLPQSEKVMLDKLQALPSEEFIIFPRNDSNFLKMQKVHLVVTYETKDNWHIYMPECIRMALAGVVNLDNHGLEIMGIGLIDIDANDCIMLRAHQSLTSKELGLRDKSMTDFYISVVKRYRKELLKLSTLIVADAYFSTSTFVNGIKKYGFSLVSRFRDNASLYYVYKAPRTGKRGRPKTKDGKIDMNKLDLTRMEKLEMKKAEVTAYTLIAYSKALKCKIRLVIWQMPNGKKKLFFSNNISLSGDEVLTYYRTMFQMEFRYRDAKGNTGLMHCQARNKWKLDFVFNASFASLNVAKVTMKEMGMEYSMSSFKALMTNTYIVRLIFKACGYNPNRTLISKIFKDLSCLQRKTA